MKARYTCVPLVYRRENFGNLLFEDLKICNICAVYGLIKQQETISETHAIFRHFSCFINKKFA